MYSSRLRVVTLCLAKLALIGPVGRFVLALIFQQRLRDDAPLSTTDRGVGIKVIACGFSRSGTFSLKRALDRLGFKCYHGFHFYYADWNNADWGRHAELWLQAATDEKWDKWDEILHGFNAIVDFPAACYYKRLMSAYPDAKVILNVREPERWYRSCMETLFWACNKLYFQVFRSEPHRKFLDAALWRGKFQGKFDNKEFALNVYKSHVEEVKRVVPKEKLLVYEVQEGWEPLCRFLQVDVPDRRFPRGNESAVFRKKVKTNERAFAVFAVMYVGFLAWVVALLLRWVS